MRIMSLMSVHPPTMNVKSSLTTWAKHIAHCTYHHQPSPAGLPRVKRVNFWAGGHPKDATQALHMGQVSHGLSPAKNLRVVGITVFHFPQEAC